MNFTALHRLLSTCLVLGLAAPLHGEDLIPRRNDMVPAQVEMIYSKGLKHLAETQSDQGNWSQRSHTNVGEAGLCVMAFMAHGEDPVHGPYAPNIRKAIDFLISQQKADNGYIGMSMYNHAFATTALAEAYGMIPDPKIAPALEKAVQLILSAQERNPRGAWRYTPDSRDADTTVAGCQLMALFAARNAGLEIPDKAIRKGLDYLAKNRTAEGSYGYTSSSSARPTMTAIGVLCFAIAKEKDGQGFENSVNNLKKNLDYDTAKNPYYFRYYMSQALFHSDDSAWEVWNQKNIRYMSTIQGADGSFPGNYGPAFSTAGALLSLALNYRYLPIYEK